MIEPKFNAKMLKLLNLEEWQHEDKVVADNLDIEGKITRREIPLNVIEALCHDATLYQKLYLENKEIHL